MYGVGWCSHSSSYSQGPDTTSTRLVSTTVDIEQIPYVMRAIGFYPSEQEVILVVFAGPTLRCLSNTGGRHAKRSKV